MIYITNVHQCQMHSLLISFYFRGNLGNVKEKGFSTFVPSTD